jgi:hypothetical protein
MPRRKRSWLRPALHSTEPSVWSSIVQSIAAPNAKPHIGTFDTAVDGSLGTSHIGTDAGSHFDVFSVCFADLRANAAANLCQHSHIVRV